MSDLAEPDFRGGRAAVVVFSYYPNDVRPRRAAEALARLGMDVEVFCLKEQGQPSHDGLNGVRIRRVRLQRLRGGAVRYLFQYCWFLLAAFFLVSWRCLKGRYDLIHVHNMPDVLVFSAIAGRLLGAKVVLDLHDPMPELMMTIFGLSDGSRAVRLLRGMEKVSVHFADAVVTVNHACKEMFAARSCPAEKITVVMNAPDEASFGAQEAVPQDGALLSDRRRPFVIMYHGTLVERHGLDLAIQALARIKESVPGAELRAYGPSTPFLELVMQAPVTRRLGEAVRYFGPGKPEEIAQAIRGCDVGIIPNRRSIFTQINTPTRIFEYLSQAKPVIAPDARGIKDYFKAGDLFFFELGNAEDLAAKLHHVFLHPEEARQVVQRGQLVYKQHTWTKERARFVNLVAQLLKLESGRRLSMVDMRFSDTRNCQ